MNYSTFVEKARAKHGDRYEYPEWVRNLTSKDKVEIICPEHGLFQQRLDAHMEGRRCKVCAAASRVVPIEEVIRRATKIHNGFYSYPAQPQYKNSKSKLRVVCPDHGPFDPIVSCHLLGTKCKDCARAGRTKGVGQVIAEATKVHKGLYSYPDTQQYKTSKSQLRIVCKIHGEFLQTASRHLGGSGCEKCGYQKVAELRRIPLGAYIKRALMKHSARYSYPIPQDLGRGPGGLRVICPIHGEFTTSITSHISNGSGCGRCGDERVSRARRYSFEKVISEANRVHGGVYTYKSSDGAYSDSKSTIDIFCKQHGWFSQTVNTHLTGGGCQTCAIKKGAEGRTFSVDKVIGRAKKVHEGKYTYPKDQSQYVNIKSMLRVRCKEHGVFLQEADAHSRGSGCPACTTYISEGELELTEFVESIIGYKVERGRGSILQGLGGYELDLILREHKIGIEYNGTYWHSDAECRNIKYHLNKTLLVESIGYRLIHVFSDEWNTKKDLVKARLRAILGVEPKRVFARKTKVVELSNSDTVKFLNETHLQGPGPNAKIRLGLVSLDSGELVAVSTIGKARYGNEGWELLRFASKGMVVGGASKLLTYFKRNFTESGQQLISFANRCWSQGKLYEALGFKFDGYSKPGYFYTKGSNTRWSREVFQKHKLEAKFDNFDASLTEADNCRNNGYYRVFDCGNSKWRLEL